MNSSLTFLDNNVVRSILRDVITPEDAPHNLLCLFASARKGEADSCLWAHMFYKRHQAIIFKTHPHCRVVPLCQALDAWLEPYFGLCGRIDTAGSAGRHFASNLSRHNIALGAHSFRTNYALNRLALGVHGLQVAREVGYDDLRPLFHKKIFNPIAWTQAEEFFGLTPEACGRPQWTLEVAEWRRQLSNN